MPSPCRELQAIGVNRPLILRPPGRLMLQPVAAAFFLAVLLSTAGAFDTEAAQFGPRLIYWLGIAGVSTLALQAAHHMLQTKFDRIPDPWLRVFGWLVLMLPLNTVATFTCKMLFGGVPSLTGFTLLLPGMAAILSALQFALFSFQREMPALRVVADTCSEPPAASANSLAPFLPLPLQRSPIHALQAEDHYVRVHTTDGQALIRMRLRDAVAMLAPEEGVQPHRSWWVARSAVASLRRDGSRTLIQLADGTTVPVSRSARSDLGPLFDERLSIGEHWIRTQH